jgi:hypothetical protein
MNKKANIKIRLELVSTNKSSLDNICEVLTLLPKPNYYQLIDKIRILDDGRVFPKPNSETLINYTNNYEEYDLENCNEKFLEFWIEYYDNLKKISTVFGYKILLNYEITIYDLHYPSLIFKKKINDFISNLDIELSLYFYND